MRSFQRSRLCSLLTLHCHSRGGLTTKEEMLLERHVPGTVAACIARIDSGYITGNAAFSRNCIDISRDVPHSKSEKLMSTSTSAALKNSRPTTTCRSAWRYSGVGIPEICGRVDFPWNIISRQSISLTAFIGIFTVRNIRFWHRNSASLAVRNEGKNTALCGNSEHSWANNRVDCISKRREREESPEFGLLEGGSESRNDNWSSDRHITGSCRDSRTSSRGGVTSSGRHNSVSTDHSSGDSDTSITNATVEKKAFSPETSEWNNSETPRGCVAEEQDALVPLGKLCAEKRLCSRREAEYFAALGLICVNGKPVTPAAGYNGRNSKFDASSTSGSSNNTSNSNGNKRKFPLFFVKRTADVQLMPRAQRVMDSRLTVLLHKPLHYLSCRTEKTEGECMGKPFCRELLISERRWEIKNNDGGSFCFPALDNTSCTTRGSRKKPRLLNPGALNKMGCAGRLDSDSSGLIVFTQDGRIASLLVGGGAVPVGKEYLVDVDLPISAGALDLLRSGSLTLDGRDLLPAHVRLLPPYCTSVLCDAPESYLDAHCRGPAPLYPPDGTPATLLPRSRDIAEVVEHLQERTEINCVAARQGSGEAAAAQDADEVQYRESNSVFVGCEGESSKHNEFKSEPHATRVEDDALWIGKTTRMAIELFEGRHRQIRRMCELVGLRVLRLHRIRIGKIRLGNLPAGRWRLLLPNERFV